MWATACRLATSGAGYQTGPVWGRFAATRKTALGKAVDELCGLTARKTCNIAGQKRRWRDGLLTGTAQETLTKTPSAGPVADRSRELGDSAKR